MSRDFWIDIFSGDTWKEFQKAGSSTSGFSESKWNTLKKVAIGDYFLCYLTGVSRFIGILEVTSGPYKKYEKDIWKEDVYPCRIKVKPIVELSPETAIPIHNLRDKLSFFQNIKHPIAWTGYVRSSPKKWKKSDGEAVFQALVHAKDNPVTLPVDKRKLKHRPKALRSKIGSVSVPDSVEDVRDQIAEVNEPDYPNGHTEIQWLLLRLGSDMGFSIWVARNDKGRQFKGNSFSDLPRLISSLPLQFDDATNRTIELIDVLWLKGNAIVAAFEIESTTSIYSGLLRMADLIAMQPNLNIPALFSSS